MVEALCNFFGLETFDGEQIKNIPNTVHAEEIEKKVQDNMMSMSGPVILMPALLLLRSIERLFTYHYKENCPMDQQLLYLSSKTRNRYRKLNLTEGALW